jgi:hypothetical protein
LVDCLDEERSDALGGDEQAPVPTWMFLGLQMKTKTVLSGAGTAGVRSVVK